MRQYLDLMQDVLDHGESKEDRTGVGTFSVFGRQLRFNLQDGFPLVTSKKIHVRSIIHELLWFISGDTNIKYLKEHGVSIWDEWADEQGNLGPVYGKQWRSWQAPDGRKVDQLANVISALKKSPDSRRHLVIAFNPSDVDKMALPPCHAFFQFYVSKQGLSCQMYQRSADLFLGVPFNIASYALLTMMVAQVCDMKAHEFILTLGDTHLYSNHIDQAKLQLSRTVKELPKMIINPDIKDIDAFKFEDFNLQGYDPHPHIKATVAV